MNKDSSLDKSQLSRDMIIQQIRQSDWSGLGGEDFCSDEEELFDYFETSSHQKAQSVASNGDSEERFLSLNPKQTHSAEENYFKVHQIEQSRKKVKTSAFSLGASMT